MSDGREFRCVICRRVLPIDQGEVLSANAAYPSWACTDAEACRAAFWQKEKTDG